MKNEERDAAICAYYSEGHSATACCKKFGLKRQRVHQILMKHGVKRRRTKGLRTKFLGISVSAQTKEALRQRADAEGVSVSKLTADALDALVVAK